MLKFRAIGPIVIAAERVRSGSCLYVVSSARRGLDSVSQKLPAYLLSRTFLGWPAEFHSAGPAHVDHRISERMIRADLLEVSDERPGLVHRPEVLQGTVMRE